MKCAVPTLCSLLLAMLIGVNTGSSRAAIAPVPGMTIVPGDSTFSGYNDVGGIGGPKAVGAQLAINDTKPAHYFRVPIRVFTPWFEWKRKLNEKTGIQLSLAYNIVYFKASAGITDSSQTWASSGLLDIQAGWTFLNRKSGKNPGKLFVKLTDRHAVGSDLSAMFLGFQTGYYGLTATGFRDYTMRFNELNWQQNLFGFRLTLVAGKVDPTNYYTFHGLVVPWRNFLQYGYSVSGTVSWPDMGWGVIAGGNITKNIYATASLNDVQGDAYEANRWLDGGDNFFSGRYFSAIEVGYVPSYEERFFRKASLTFWHADPFTVTPTGAASEEGQGVAFAGHWFLKEKYIPFVLFGFSNGKGFNAFYKKEFSIGMGYRFLSHDILGLGLNWAEPNIPDTKNQSTAEIYYRFTITEHLEITPDFQVIHNPTLNPATDWMTYFGIRARFTL